LPCVVSTTSCSGGDGFECRPRNRVS
jgi:hypothetical protein